MLEVGPHWGVCHGSQSHIQACLKGPLHTLCLSYGCSKNRQGRAAPWHQGTLKYYPFILHPLPAFYKLAQVHRMQEFSAVLCRLLSRAT